MIDKLLNIFEKSNYKLHEADVGLLMQYIEFKEITKKNEILLNANDLETKAYFLLEGILRIYNFENGREYTRNIFTEGDFFTESSSFFTGISHGFQIDSIMPSKIYYIRKEHFHELQSRSQVLTQFFAKQLERALVFMILRNSDLQKPAIERYKTFRNQKPQLFGKIPDYILSSYLNITPEAFSRIQKSLNTQ
jgi:CRP-like cAMP-binding protein